MSSRRNNFSKTSVLHSSTSHYGIHQEVGEIEDWLNSRLHQRISGVEAAHDNLSLYTTVHDGETFFADGHISHFVKLVIATEGEKSVEEEPGLAFVRRLQDVSGRPVLSGDQIRRVRLQQARASDCS